MRDREDICRDIIDVSVRLHRELGPGLLESVYEMLLAGRLAAMGYDVVRQRSINVMFDGIQFEGAFKIDLLVDEAVLVEIKSVEKLNPVHAKQLLTYLRLTRQPIGLLINFGGETLKEGLRRIVNNYRPLASSRLRVNQNQES